MNVEYLIHLARRAIRSEDQDLIDAGESVLSFCVVHLKADTVLIPRALQPAVDLINDYVAAMV
jgi:hypothetical protein